MTFSNHAVLGLGTFPSFQDAEEALEKLKHSGFPTSRFSFLAKCANRHDTLSTVSLCNQHVSALPLTTDLTSSGIRGSLVDLVAHPDAFALADTGCVIAGGRLSSVISSLASSKMTLMAAFRTLAIPEESARLYRDRIERGDCLVGIESSSNDILQADKILQYSRISYWQIHQVAVADRFTSPVGSPLPTDTCTIAAASAPPVSTRPATFSRSTTAPVNAPSAHPAPSGYTQLGIGAFRHHAVAEVALRDLHKAGFPMNHVSIIARDSSRIDIPNAVEQLDASEQGQVRFDQIASIDSFDTCQSRTGQGATTGALAGGTLGGLTGLLLGLGALMIPGVGPILLAGTAATALGTTLVGSAVGAAAGGFVGAMVGLGIPEDRAEVYRDRLSEGYYLAIVTGTEAELSLAEQFLNARGIEDWDVYEPVDQTPEPAYTVAYRDTDIRSVAH